MSATFIRCEVGMARSSQISFKLDIETHKAPFSSCQVPRKKMFDKVAMSNELADNLLGWYRNQVNAQINYKISQQTYYAFHFISGNHNINYHSPGG